jgi:hypothetical protein
MIRRTGRVLLGVTCISGAIAGPTTETLANARLADLLSKCIANGGGICAQVDREAAILPHTETTSISS